MPNQVNYPDPIPVPYIEYRPERLSEEDRNLVQNRIDQILFGTSERDYAELWVYDSNGGIAGHVNLNVTDPAISLSTIVSNTGAYELLNIDMTQAIQTMLVESGRYGFTANFFRDEVGSEYIDDTAPELGSGERLFITDISDDRTELRLSPKTVTPKIVQEIYEWVVPSVPKLYAQALVDQTFGESLPTDSNDTTIAVPEEEILSASKVMAALNALNPDTEARITAAGATNSFNTMVTAMVEEIGILTLELMAADPSNKNVQEEDLLGQLGYISEATAAVIHKYQSAGIDARFEVTNR